MTNSPITTLTCPSCGGKLQISQKVNRFACGYCGNEQLVHRESGIVYLEPIAEDVRHIRAGVEGMRGGVDKTAAELAIARLTKELNDLESELKSSLNRSLYSWKPRPDFESVLVAASFVMFFVAVNTRNAFVWIIFLCCLAGWIYMWITRHGAANRIKAETIEYLEFEINETKTALTKNRRLV